MWTLSHYALLRPQYPCLSIYCPNWPRGKPWNAKVYHLGPKHILCWLHFHFSLSCIGEGNGNPLQCSCLENPRDGGAWWAPIYGVTQSRTQVKWLSSSSSSLFLTEPSTSFWSSGSITLSKVVIPLIISCTLERSKKWPHRGHSLKFKEILSPWLKNFPLKT